MYRTLLCVVLLSSIKARQEVEVGDEELKLDPYFSASCDEFFHGPAWPMTKGYANKGVVKLCQNQKHSKQTIVFATLFSTKDRYPIYTANKVVLVPKGHEYPRPEPYLWTRVSLTLCNIQELPTQPVLSMIGHVAKHLRDQCGKYQALNEDYVDNTLDLNRGHLSPNAINNEDLTKQSGTFTLTNAAPQFALFNQFSWREYECVAQYTILELVPKEEVFIMTGTYGTAYDSYHNPLFIDGKETNPVKVPGYYWKIVCYAGNATENKDPWAYAIIQKNINVKSRATYASYMLLKDFASKYFVDPPFGEDCMNAPFGAFEKYLVPQVFEQFIEKYCDAGKLHVNQSEANKFEL